MKFGLDQHTIDNIVSVFEQYSKVDKAFLFGSRAKGNYRTDSDIDIAIKGQDLNTDDIIAMSVAFEEKGIAYGIDLINYQIINEPDLKDHIDRVGIELYNIWQKTKIGILPSDWKLMTLDEIKSKEKKAIISGPFGSSISSKYFVNNGIPIIRGNNLSLGLGKKFNDDGFVFITEEKANELGTWAVKDDIIFTAVGTIGQVGILLGSEKYKKYIISNKQLRLRIDKEVVSPLFAYYWFASPAMIDTIEQRNTGSSVPLINLSVLKSLYIPIPEKWEQDLIVKVLCTLDNKIDLLQRQNKTLEQLAETLFRQWFVEEAEESWEEKKLGELLTITSSKRIFYSEYVSSGIPFYRSKEIIELRNNGSTSSELHISNERFNEIDNKFGSPQEGDILMTSVGTLGVAYRVKKSDKFYFKDGNLTWFKDFIGLPSSIIYLWLISAIGQENLASITIGSTQEALTIEGLKGISFKIPPKEKIRGYEIEFNAIIEKMEFNQIQIRTLTQTRDSLLPKLMSGEVRLDFKD